MGQRGVTARILVRLNTSITITSIVYYWCGILRLVTWTGFEFRILVSSTDAHTCLEVRTTSLVGYMEPRGIRSTLYVSSRLPVDQLPGTIVFYVYSSECLVPPSMFSTEKSVRHSDIVCYLATVDKVLIAIG